MTRPTRNGSELSKTEMDGGVEVLEAKIRRFQPESACIVGKSIWESIWRVRHGRKMKKDEFKYGWQDDTEKIGAMAEEGIPRYAGARVFVATSTSGLAVSLTFPLLGGRPFFSEQELIETLGKSWPGRKAENMARVRQLGPAKEEREGGGENGE